MRRPFLSFLLLAFGALPVVWGASTAAAAPVSPACGGDFATLVGCSADAFGEGPVTVTLRTPVDYRTSDGKAETTVSRNRDSLIVQVPSNARTGEGGTVLLLLAGNRDMADDATVDLLEPDTVARLKHLGVCRVNKSGNECDAFAVDTKRDPDKKTITGKELIGQGLADALDRHAITVSSPAPSPTPTRTAPVGKGGNSGAKADDGGGSSTSGILISVIALLVIVLGVLVFLIRRTGGALPHAFAAAGFGGTSAPSHTATTAAAPALGGGDEPTTVVRPRPKEPPRGPGRAVGPRRGQFRTAVVRTELHPQGYVEVERVLYRAVWADPSQPPPPPGGVIDLTEPHDPDDDVFYAFPSEQQPATGAR